MTNAMADVNMRTVDMAGLQSFRYSKGYKMEDTRLQEDAKAKK